MSLDAHPVEYDELLAHSRWIRALARSLVADPSLADDADQQTWLAAVEKPPHGRGNLRAWLAQVVRRRLYNIKRGRRRQVAYAQKAPNSARVPSTADLVCRAETRTMVAQAVLSLEAPYRITGSTAGGGS